MGRTYSISQCRYINGIDVRNDPSLALQKNHNEKRIKNRRKNTSDTYKTGQRLWKAILVPRCFNETFLTNV
jgi:hypothetical protein